MAAYKDISADQMVTLAKAILDKNETSDQKHCQYCHYPFKHIWNDELSDDCISYEFYKGKAQLYISVDGVAFTVPIEYCPKCGRKL